MYSESISELEVNRDVAELLFQLFQRSIVVPLCFAKAAHVVIQTDVRLTTTAYDCFPMTDLAEKRSCPEIAARAMDVNTLAVEIESHRRSPFVNEERSRSKRADAGSSVGSWRTSLPANARARREGVS